ncbi:hypothetical protein SUGI_1098040 [Cryptomeria japonica]|nr:hypothetical protein SUGI_1098040 [Cryptomeria japonica]
MEGTETERKGEMNAQKIENLLKPFSKEQMFEILSHAVSNYPSLLEYTEKLAEKNPAHRKVFVSGLAPKTTSQNLKFIFSVYGEVEECKVVIERDNGRSKGYAFVTYKHMEGFKRALKNPCLIIDSRKVVCQVCCEENEFVEPVAVTERMIYVRNVPGCMDDEMLLTLFSSYGEIEAGPIRFDRVTRHALFICVTVEGARNAIVNTLQGARKGLVHTQMLLRLQVTMPAHHEFCQLQSSNWRPNRSNGRRPQFGFLPDSDLSLGLLSIPHNDSPNVEHQ